MGKSIFEISVKVLFCHSLDEASVGLHAHGREGAVRDSVVKDVAAVGVPDGVVEGPHPLQVQVHGDKLELGLGLLHRET